MSAGGPVRSLGAQVVLLAVARLSTVAALFGVSVIGARLLSADEIGSVAVGQTIGMLAALVANGGLNLATIYFLQRRPAERRASVQRLVALAVAACSLALILVVASAPIVFLLVLGEDSWPLIVSAGLMGAGMIAFEFGGALLLGLDQPGRFTVLEVIRGWTSIAAVGVLLAGPWRSDAGLVLGLGLGYAAAATVGLRWVHRSGMSVVPRYERGFSGVVVRFGLRGQVGNVFQFLGLRLDLLIVPALLGLGAAGIYFVAARVSEVVGQAATAAASLVFPRVAAEQDHSRSTLLTERVVRVTIVVVALSAILLTVAGELVLGVAFGAQYRTGAGALAILLVGTLPLAISRIIAADLKGRGRPGLVSIAAGVSVIATIVLDFALVPLLGIEGAALASLITYGVTAAALLWAYRAVSGGRLAALVPRPSDIGWIAGAVRRRAPPRGTE